MSKKNSSKKPKLWKKIGRALFKLFSAIYGVIDKIIITPVAKVLMIFSKLLKSNNKPIDRLLNNKLVLITISLILAFTAYYLVDGTTEIMLNSSAEILYKQKVTALYNEEAYVVEGLPESVDIILIGRRADLYLAKQYPTEEVVADLRDLKPGSHKVSLKYSGSVSSVEYKLDPSSATVMIYEKVSESRTIYKEILNENKLNSKYTISSISFSREDAYIKGAEYKLKEVAIVKALVDVSEIANRNIGTTTLKDIPLVAYNSKGEKLDVEIVPGTIDATIEIKSPKKEVPLKVIPEGNVVFGKAIGNISLSETKATIYGDEESLANITYLPVKINVEGISSTTDYNVNIAKPSGIKEISVNTVKVKVTLDEIKEKTIENVSIATKNLSEGLTAQAASSSDSAIDVIVKGSQTNLKAVTNDNITAYVDLQGLGVGSHTIDVKVTGDDLKLTYEPKTTKVTIVIKKSN